MNTMPTYTPEQPESPASSTRNRNLALAAAAVVALLALLAGGLLVVRSAATSTDAQASTIAVKPAAQGAVAATSTAPAADEATEADAPAADDAPVTVAPDNNTGGNNTGGNPVGNPTPQPAAPSGPAPAPKPAPTTAPPAPKPVSPAPVITSFVTPENIDCHNGNFQTFSASWTTTNAVKTTISIDGPGVYKTYAANDSDSLPFNCSSAHSFKLTAFGQDGKTVAKTITLQPRNVQTPGPVEDEE